MGFLTGVLVPGMDLVDASTCIAKAVLDHLWQACSQIHDVCSRQLHIQRRRPSLRSCRRMARRWPGSGLSQSVCHCEWCTLLANESMACWKILQKVPSLKLPARMSKRHPLTCQNLSAPLEGERFHSCVHISTCDGRCMSSQWTLSFTKVEA